MNFLGYVHRDFKPKNLVIDGENGKVVLIDFEMSSNLQEGREERFKGTPGFFDPNSERNSGSKVWDLAAFAASLLFRMGSKANYQETDSWEATLELAKVQLHKKSLPKWTSMIVKGILDVETEEEVMQIEAILKIIEEEIKRQGGEVELFGS
jgi:serine/threonine protein kinase